MPDAITPSYAGIVSRDSIHALVYAKLIGLEIGGGDIQNAYIQAPSTEKPYVICGPEFGLENVGCCAFIQQALYGGKVAGADFGIIFGVAGISWASLPHMPIQMCGSREQNKHQGRSTTNMCFSMWMMSLLFPREIGQEFVLKDESIGKSSYYLGGKLCEVTLENGVSAWSFSLTQYV